MSEEIVDNEVADATVNVDPREKDEAQDAAITDRAQSADDEHGDGDHTSDVSSGGQSAGETTDSATPQAAGEEAGSEGSSTPDADAVVAVPAAPPSPEPASSESAIPEVSTNSSAVGEDEKTAPLGESDNDDDEDDNASTKKKKSPIKKKYSSRYEPPPPFVDDPSKVTLRFIFPNKDGLNVTVDCKPTDTVGEVKGMLLSMWPDGKFTSFWVAALFGRSRSCLICFV